MSNDDRKDYADPRNVKTWEAMIDDGGLSLYNIQKLYGEFRPKPNTEVTIRWKSKKVDMTIETRKGELIEVTCLLGEASDMFALAKLERQAGRSKNCWFAREYNPATDKAILSVVKEVK